MGAVARSLILFIKNRFCMAIQSCAFGFGAYFVEYFSKIILCNCFKISFSFWINPANLTLRFFCVVCVFNLLFHNLVQYLYCCASVFSLLFVYVCLVGAVARSLLVFKSLQLFCRTLRTLGSLLRAVLFLLHALLSSLLPFQDHILWLSSND